VFVTGLACAATIKSAEMMTRPTNTHPPLVTVGMPVYRAERFLRRAIDSILGQDYANLEVIISDNGSADGTQSICEEYARLDRRVTYCRQPVNRGSVWNFNQVFDLGHGDYFAWAADDDWRGPGFLAACVSALEQEPAAVLCASGAVTVGDATGRASRVPAVKITEPTAIGRVRRLLRYRRQHINYSSLIYGVFRSDSLRRAMPFQQSWGADIVLLWRLACIGTFLQLDDEISYFRSREVGADEYNEICRSGIVDPTIVDDREIPRLACWNRLSVGSRGLWELPLRTIDRTLLLTILAADVLTDRDTYVEAAYTVARAIGLR
jgi:glycosyltransferase involved in cell wall biosynthesis